MFVDPMSCQIQNYTSCAITQFVQAFSRTVKLILLVINYNDLVDHPL